MYYRGSCLLLVRAPHPPLNIPTPGANAALLLYDITNASTFNDVRGWLEGPFAFLARSKC